MDGERLCVVFDKVEVLTVGKEHAMYVWTKKSVKMDRWEMCYGLVWTRLDWGQWDIRHGSEEIFESTVRRITLNDWYFRTYIGGFWLYGAEQIFGTESGEIRRDWRQLNNEELHDLSSSTNISRLIKSRTMRWYTGLTLYASCIILQ